MADCDCFNKNCRRQFAVVGTDQLICAGSPPSPLIFTEPPSSPTYESDSSPYDEMALLEGVNDVGTQPNLIDDRSESPEYAATQPYLTVDESTQRQFPSQAIFEPETIICEGKDVYNVQHEVDGAGDDEIGLQDERNLQAASSADKMPEVATGGSDEPEVASPEVGVSSAQKHSMSADDDHHQEQSKKSKCEPDRPGTPRPNQSYSEADEKTLLMYQDKLLRDSLAEARNTYVASTDLLLYKLRRINFNSDVPRDMISSLRILGALNRLYRTANLELDRLQQDEFGAEFFND